MIGGNKQASRNLHKPVLLVMDSQDMLLTADGLLMQTKPNVHQSLYHTVAQQLWGH